MSEETPPAESGHGPVRRRAIAIMTPIFVILLVTMLVLGLVLVVLQIAGLIVVNPGFIIGVAEVLNPWAFGVAAALGIFTLLLSYAHGWKPAD